MNLAMIFIAGQIYNESTSKTEEIRPNGERKREHSAVTKRKDKERGSSVSPITIKPQPTEPTKSPIKWTENTATKMVADYNHDIDQQFVEDVMSDIELNWSAEDSLDRACSLRIQAINSDQSSEQSPNHLHPDIITTYTEIEQFHSDVTVSDLDGDLESRSRTTTPLPTPTPKVPNTDERIIDDLMDDLESDLADHESSQSQSIVDIQKYLVQRYAENKSIFFDQMAVTSSNGKVTLLDSKGLTSGCHEWSIQILKADVDLQEIGVIGTDGIASIEVDDHGIWNTAACKARCVYGNELSDFSSFIAALKEDGSLEYQDLSKQRRIGWCVYDTITVKVDLERWTIRFSLNGKWCGEEMQLQRGMAYFPVISFAGQCLFDLR